MQGKRDEVKKHEVIVVGGGHNGLTCAAYLARAGVDVLVLEQRHIVGGPCAEYEFFPGYRASMTNSPGSLEPKIVADLELERFGLTFTRPNPTLMFPFPDGRAFVGFREPERVEAQIRQFSVKDVDGYPALFDFPQSASPSVSGSRSSRPRRRCASSGRALKTPADEEAFAKVFLGSVAELLDEYLESPHLKAPIAQLGLVSNWLGPFSAGSAAWLLARPMSLASSRVDAAHDPRRQVLRGSTGLPLGGMGSIVRTMRQSLEEAGGTVRTEARVVRILAGDEGARGVVLEDGEEIDAGVVVSNLNPWTTFLELVEPDRLDSDFRARVSALPKKGFTFKFALSLDALPRFAASPKGLERACAGCQFRIAPSIEYQERAFDDAKYGRCAEAPTFWGLFPSVADPGLAPPGKHVLSGNVFQAPIDLAEGSWETERERYGNHCIRVLEEYMPGLDGLIIDKRFWSPVDLEREFGLPGSNIAHLDMTPRHLFGLRPLPGCSDYTTPLRGLYLCGSSCWPGGTVTGVPGHNASRKILGDLARQHGPRRLRKAS